MQGLPLDIGVINAPDLCIASGASAAIEELGKRLAAQGREGRRLHIKRGRAFAPARRHPRALPPGRRAASGCRTPTMPFISNLTGDWADAALLSDPDYWVRHLRQPVRFADGAGAAAGDGRRRAARGRPGPGPVRARAPEPAGPAAHRAAVDLQGERAERRPVADAHFAGRAVGARPRAGLEHRARRRIAAPHLAAHLRLRPPAPLDRAGQGRARGRAGAGRRAAAVACSACRRWTNGSACRNGARRRCRTCPPRQAGPQWLVLGGADASHRGRAAPHRAKRAARCTLVRHGAAFAAARGWRLHDRRRRRARSSSNCSPRWSGPAALPDHVVHLWSLETGARGSGAGLLLGQALAFDSLVHFAKAMQTLDLRQAMRLTVVTAGGQAVDGRPGRGIRCAASRSAPCRVIPREVPNCRARCWSTSTRRPRVRGDVARGRVRGVGCVRVRISSPGAPARAGWRNSSRRLRSVIPAKAGIQRSALRRRRR